MRGRAVILFWQISATAGGLVAGIAWGGRSAEAFAAALLGAMLLIAAATVCSARRTARSSIEFKSLGIQLKLARAERDYAHSILAGISDAVLVTDSRGGVVMANESAARTFDSGCQNALPDRSLIGGVVPDAKLAALIRDMQGSGGSSGPHTVEHPLRTPTGEKFFRVTFSRLAGAAMKGSAPPHSPQAVARNRCPVESAPAVVTVLHDVTRERESAELKNHFVASVSHELRTPLASIKAYIEMLVDGEADDEATRGRFYDVIQKETGRLTRLIDDILSISSIESGLVRVDRRPRELSAVLRQAMELIAPQAGLKQQQLVGHFAPGVWVAADEDMIHRAVLNLLSNAVKYTPAGGSIRVETVLDPGRNTVTARVCDTGVGIPPKDVPFVFDKFYRVEANNHMAKGTGLGLSLVKHIVETVHGGRIFVESRLGTGSCFGFELGVCQDAGPIEGGK